MAQKGKQMSWRREWDGTRRDERAAKLEREGFDIMSRKMIRKALERPLFSVNDRILYC
jgi:hypothetical protein